MLLHFEVICNAILKPRGNKDLLDDSFSATSIFYNMAGKNSSREQVFLQKRNCKTVVFRCAYIEFECT